MTYVLSNNERGGKYRQYKKDFKANVVEIGN